MREEEALTARRRIRGRRRADAAARERRSRPRKSSPRPKRLFDQGRAGAAARSTPSAARLRRSQRARRDAASCPVRRRNRPDRTRNRHGSLQTAAVSGDEEADAGADARTPDRARRRPPKSGRCSPRKRTPPRVRGARTRAQAADRGRPQNLHRLETEARTLSKMLDDQCRKRAVAARRRSGEGRERLRGRTRRGTRRRTRCAVRCRLAHALGRRRCGAGDPALPPGVTPLTQHVQAPPALPRGVWRRSASCCVEKARACADCSSPASGSSPRKATCGAGTGTPSRRGGADPGRAAARCTESPRRSRRERPKRAPDAKAEKMRAEAEAAQQALPPRNRANRASRAPRSAQSANVRWPRRANGSPPPSGGRLRRRACRPCRRPGRSPSPIATRRASASARPSICSTNWTSRLRSPARSTARAPPPRRTAPPPPKPAPPCRR